MSYSTIRAALLAKIRAALGNGWTVEVGARPGDVDLDQWSMAQVALLIPASRDHETSLELDGSDQEVYDQWAVVYGVRYPAGREAEADVIVHDAMDAVATALKGDMLDSTCGPLERTTDTNMSAETIRLTWSQGWRHMRYPA